MNKSNPTKKQKNNVQSSVNLKDWNIHMTARENRTDVTKLLVDQGVDINARNGAAHPTIRSLERVC